MSRRANLALAGLGLVVSIQAQIAFAQPVGTTATTESARFEIKRYEVTGNTLLPQTAIDAVLAPHTGAGKQFSDIQLALEALETAFRRAGFGMVQVHVPEQEVEGGVVRFAVIEAKLGKVAIEGNRFFSVENIRRSLPSLKEGAAPDTADLDVELQMAAESPAKQTRLLLRSGAAQGQVDATISVTDEKPWKLIGTIDNSGSDATGRFRVGLGFQHANLASLDDVFNLQAITSPGHTEDVKIFGTGYHLPFYGLRSALDLIAGYSNVNSGTVRGLFNVSGKGTVYSARWTYYLPKLAAYEQKLAIGYDRREYRNAAEFGGVNTLPSYRLKPLNLTYSGLWRMAQTEVGFHASGTRNTSSGGQALSMVRAGAPSGYALARLGLTVAHALPLGAQMRVSLNGQYTKEPLVPAEQFGLGGPDSVRGYQARAVSGDRGYAGQLELYSPDFGRALGFDSVGVRALVFYDWGKVSRLQPQPGESSGDTVSGAGIGMRLGVSRRWSLRGDLARARNAASTGIAGLQRRADFSLVLFF